MATVCSVKKAGGCRKCFRKEHDAFLLCSVKFCECFLLVLEALCVIVYFFLFVSVANINEVFVDHVSFSPKFFLHSLLLL